MEITGKVTALLPREVRDYKSAQKAGQKFAIDKYVIETIDQYPKHIMMEVISDSEHPRWKAMESLVKVGNAVSASFEIDAREYNGKWYNTIRCFKVAEANQQEAPATSDNDMVAQLAKNLNATVEHAATQQTMFGEGNADDLPF